jgi:hypothetical protein
MKPQSRDLSQRVPDHLLSGELIRLGANYTRLIGFAPLFGNIGSLLYSSLYKAHTALLLTVRLAKFHPFSFSLNVTFKKQITAPIPSIKAIMPAVS